MKRTNAEILICYLELMGNKRVLKRSSKYTVFENRRRPGMFYYIGRNGAFRVGKNIQESCSCTDHINMSEIQKWVEERELNSMSHEVCVAASEDIPFVQWWMKKLEEPKIPGTLGVLNSLTALSVEEFQYIVRSVANMNAVVRAYNEYHEVKNGTSSDQK